VEVGVDDRSTPWFWICAGKADRMGSCIWGGAGSGEGGLGDSSTFNSESGAGSGCVCTTGAGDSSHVDSCTVVGSSQAVGTGGSGSEGG
jgi:hypothetical protein